MADVFDIQSSGDWTYTAEASTVLATTTVAQGGSGFGDTVRGPVAQAEGHALDGPGTRRSHLPRLIRIAWPVYAIWRGLRLQALPGDYGRAQRKPPRGRRRQRPAAHRAGALRTIRPARAGTAGAVR